MRVLFTGASSFTGYWFVKQLVAAGHEVCATIRGTESSYEGLRGQRVAMVKGLCETVFECPFGSEAFLNVIQHKWDILCHHAADVTDYKSPDFDAVTALKSNTLNLRSVLASFPKVLLTGSVFEQGEGVGSDPERAVSPYGLSKGLTADYFRYYCLEQSVSLGKFVIPNPFGPFEEPRFTSYLMHTWKKGEKANIKTPDYVRDNVHASLLALAYADCLKKIDNRFVRFCPSGYVESQGEFVQRFAQAMRSRTGWPCDVVLSKQDTFSEPRVRINTQPIVMDGWNEEHAWDEMAAYYLALLEVKP